MDVTATASLALVKSADPTVVTAAGQVVTYSFLVTNNGDTTVTGLAVADTAFSGSGTPSTITCPVTTLAPGEETTCVSTYTVTQADIDAGNITDTAVATGEGPAGEAPTSPSSVVVDTVVGAELSLTKVADPVTVSAAGQQVLYRYVVTNAGTVTLTGLSVTDIAFTGTGTRPVITCPETTLAPGDETQCTGTYTVTQADIDAGTPIDDTAEATATTPGGTPVASDEASASVDVAVAGSLAMVKVADPTAVTDPGQEITYTFLVTNNGNVTITRLTVAETFFSGSGTPSPITCVATTLAPGEETACESTYTVTHADLDAGEIADTAVASGTGPAGGTITSPPSSATVEAETVGTLSLFKAAAPESVTGAGQHIEYSFTGSGTLGPAICPEAEETLAPGETITCTADYTTTEHDVAQGSVSNTAEATATEPDGEQVTSPPATAVVTVHAARPTRPTQAGPLAVTGMSLAGWLIVASLLTIAGTVMRMAGARRGSR